MSSGTATCDGALCHTAALPGLGAIWGLSQSPRSPGWDLDSHTPRSCILTSFLISLMIGVSLALVGAGWRRLRNGILTLHSCRGCSESLTSPASLPPLAGD